MSKHRAVRARSDAVRPGRFGLAALAVAVTGLALVAGTGLIPVVDRDLPDATGAVLDPARGADTPAESEQAEDGPDTGPAVTGIGAPEQADAADTALPDGSGDGRRVVFSQTRQRVWLVNAQGRVAATYLASGSVLDNLRPGDYRVYSRSRWAVGIDNSGVMEYFVRFTRGERGAIGFHSIPKKNGKPLQTAADLGTPRSHGCIRQKLSDAERLWSFAPVGTDVVVV